ncbi:MAG: hypothetical protein E5Y10_24655 [Mesorhizobium sp.]|nr:MAG: hypothetical protein E5Y10_24655 [Mesorhizobium sp.]
MGEIERIIIDAKAGNLILQVQAAHAAMTAGIEEGAIYGLRKDGKYFGVKRNKTSIRVYPQERR